METSGIQVDETLQEIGMLTLGKQELETGDALGTQLTGVDIGDAGETELAGVDIGDAGETELAGVETRDAEENQQGHARSEEEHDQISGASGSENNPLQEESTDPVKLAAYSEASAIHEQLPVKVSACSEAGVRPKPLPDLFDLKKMLKLVHFHILSGQTDSVMDVARKIKEGISQEPKPPKLQDWILLADKGGVVGKYYGQRQPKTATKDGNQRLEALAIARCLEKMNAVVIDTVNDLERGRLGILLCLLSEDLAAVLESLNYLEDDLFIIISLQCFSNKASGFLQQLKFSEGIQVYESCIAKIRQRLGANVLLGQFLTMLGELRLCLAADSPQGLNNLRDARIVLHNAVTTSDVENQCRFELLGIIDDTLEVKASASEPEDSRKVKSLRETKMRFVSKFRTFFRKFPKWWKRSSDPSACS